nr:proline-rich protein HaeIII subfamily 1-like [Dasypus novemcinctus]
MFISQQGGPRQLLPGGVPTPGQGDPRVCQAPAGSRGGEMVAPENAGRGPRRRMGQESRGAQRVRGSAWQGRGWACSPARGCSVPPPQAPPPQATPAHSAETARRAPGVGVGCADLVLLPGPGPRAGEQRAPARNPQAERAAPPQTPACAGLGARFGSRELAVGIMVQQFLLDRFLRVELAAMIGIFSVTFPPNRCPDTSCPAKILKQPGPEEPPTLPSCFFAGDIIRSVVGVWIGVYSKDLNLWTVHVMARP